MLKDFWSICAEPAKDFIKALFGLLMLASLILWIIIINNIITEKNALAELVENPCSLVVVYIQDGEIVEEHLEIEDDTHKIVFDDGTPIRVCISTNTGSDEGTKRYYLKFSTDAE